MPGCSESPDPARAAGDLLIAIGNIKRNLFYRARGKSSDLRVGIISDECGELESWPKGAKLVNPWQGD